MIDLGDKVRIRSSSDSQTKLKRDCKRIEYSVEGVLQKGRLDRDWQQRDGTELVGTGDFGLDTRQLIDWQEVTLQDN